MSPIMFLLFFSGTVNQKPQGPKHSGLPMNIHLYLYQRPSPNNVLFQSWSKYKMEMNTMIWHNYIIKLIFNSRLIFDICFKHFDN